MPSFKEDFQQALAAPDAEFGKQIDRFQRLLILGYAPDNQLPPRPAGVSREAHLYSLIDSPLVEGLRLKVEFAETGNGRQQVSLHESTGLNANMLVERNGDSADRYSIGKMELSPHVCSSCMKPEVAHTQYSCSDLSDPAQVRGGQLVRMMVALHEMGHHASALEGIMFRGNQNHPDAVMGRGLQFRNDTGMSERRADLFAGSIMIAQLGQEGISFLRQFAAGFRADANGRGNGHDTAQALGVLIEQAERNPRMFDNMSLAEISIHTEVMASAITPTRNQSEIVRRAAIDKFFPAPADNGQRPGPYDLAQQRLEWFQTEMAANARGEGKVQPAVLLTYEQFFKAGDSVMLDAQGKAQNLQNMVDLGPLKGNPQWAEQAEQNAQTCRASATAAAKPKPEL